MTETRYVWVIYPDVDYDSRWHTCSIVGQPAGGMVTIEMDAEAPPVTRYRGTEQLGSWPGAGIDAEWLPGTGSRTITVPAGIVHREPGGMAGGHPSYTWPHRLAHQPVPTMRLLARRVRRLVGAA